MFRTDSLSLMDDIDIALTNDEDVQLEYGFLRPTTRAPSTPHPQAPAQNGEMMRLRVQCCDCAVQCCACAANPTAAQTTAAPKPGPPASEDKKVENTAKAAGAAAKTLAFMTNLGNSTSMHARCARTAGSRRKCTCMPHCRRMQRCGQAVHAASVPVAEKCEHSCKSGSKPVTNPFFKPSANGCAAPMARVETLLVQCARVALGRARTTWNVTNTRSMQPDGWHTTCSPCLPVQLRPIKLGAHSGSYLWSVRHD